MNMALAMYRLAVAHEHVERLSADVVLRDATLRDIAALEEL